MLLYELMQREPPEGLVPPALVGYLHGERSKLPKELTLENILEVTLAYTKETPSFGTTAREAAHPVVQPANRAGDSDGGIDEPGGPPWGDSDPSWPGRGLHVSEDDWDTELPSA